MHLSIKKTYDNRRNHTRAHWIRMKYLTFYFLFQVNITIIALVLREIAKLQNVGNDALSGVRCGLKMVNCDM